MGLFCCKKEKKPTKLIKEKKMVEVGKAIIRYTFEDGRVFESIVYGQAYDANPRHHVVGYEYGYVEILSIKDSILSHLNNGRPECLLTIVDDQYNPRHSMTGKVVESKVIDILKHEIEVEVTKECLCD